MYKRLFSLAAAGALGIIAWIPTSAKASWLSEALHAWFGPNQPSYQTPFYPGYTYPLPEYPRRGYDVNVAPTYPIVPNYDTYRSGYYMPGYYYEPNYYGPYYDGRSYRYDSRQWGYDRDGRSWQYREQEWRERYPRR
jgi:hypothetical protein